MVTIGEAAFFFIRTSKDENERSEASFIVARIQKLEVPMSGIIGAGARDCQQR